VQVAIAPCRIVRPHGLTGGRKRSVNPTEVAQGGPPAVNHSSTAPHYVLGMDGTQTLAVKTLRELLDNPERDDWDELVAANRAVIRAIATCRPMTRRNARIVAEYLREAGWCEGAIGAATAQAGAHADFGETG
jgi:hypothetical protein